MKPYFVQKGIRVYHGDCQEVLRHIRCVDITVSSPPYNTIKAKPASGMLAECRSKIAEGYASYNDSMPEEEYQAFVRRVFSRCAEVSRGLVWINHKTRFRNKCGIHPLQIFPWKFYSEIVWDRCGSITLNARKFAPSHEFIYGFGQPHFWDSQSNRKLSVWRIPPERNVPDHTCPFPIEIASRCIAASCPPNGTVLDPFCGSGTSLVAARNLGRKAVGIEMDKDYCDLTIARLRDEVRT